MWSKLNGYQKILIFLFAKSLFYKKEIFISIFHIIILHIIFYDCLCIYRKILIFFIGICVFFLRKQGKEKMRNY